jgi:hypothetical protein
MRESVSSLDKEKDVLYEVQNHEEMNMDMIWICLSSCVIVGFFSYEKWVKR